MKDNALSKLGGTCSILAGLALIVEAVVLLLLPREQQVDPASCNCADTFLTSVAHSSTLLRVGFGLLALVAIFSIAAVLAISARVLAAHEGWVRWTSTLAIIGLALNAIDLLRRMALESAIATAYVRGDGAVKAALTVPGAVQSSDPQGWFKFGGVGLWILVVSLLALRGGKEPKLLSVVGILFALAGWLVVAGEVVAQSQSAVLIAGGVFALLAPIWYIWQGLRLRRAG
ncbi:MAG TPA: DUF4386 family protein [Ktedonobacterales bacterium]|nr:DUF4386 family protein [Ktedonobacterales bacterium]